MASGNGSSAKDFYEDEKHLMKLCDFLRSSEGPPVREAVEMDKRVYYIKGSWIAAHFS
jgi:translocation protein SEC62